MKAAIFTAAAALSLLVAAGICLRLALQARRRATVRVEVPENVETIDSEGATIRAPVLTAPVMAGAGVLLLVLAHDA